MGQHRFRRPYGDCRGARSKEWDIAIPPKRTGSVVLKTVGVVDYNCRFHPNMKGRVIVEDKPPPPEAQ
jgi:plastocyanin